MEDIKAIEQEYMELCHAMQSGVAMMINYDNKATEPKHLRVGINSALVDSGALAGLLIEKGVITKLEYLTALRNKMKEEVARYERLLSDRNNGAAIHLK